MPANDPAQYEMEEDFLPWPSDTNDKPFMTYDKCKRDNALIAKFKASPQKLKWADRTYSKTHGSELQMQTEAEQMLKDSAIQYQSHIQRELQVPGCQMRADLAGYNWAIETKKECSSQGMLTAMAQCQVYRKHLNKRYVCILLPDDIEPARFGA